MLWHWLMLAGTDGSGQCNAGVCDSSQCIAAGDGYC